MRRSWKARGHLLLALAATGLGPATGCKYVATLGYLFSPPREKKAEYKLNPGRMALLVEAKRPEEYNPVFVEALQERVKDIFQEKKIKVELVPQEDILRLRQQNPDFDKWSVQKIGKRLNVPLVLLLTIEQLSLRASPEMPVFEPKVHLRLKLIGADQPPPQARLWPSLSEAAGREIEVSRPAIEVTSAMVFDEQATKLGHDTAWEVAGPFYDVDLETVRMREP